MPQQGIYSPPVSDCNNRTGRLVGLDRAGCREGRGGVTPVAHPVPSLVTDRQPCPPKTGYLVLPLAQPVPVSSLPPATANTRTTEQVFYFRPVLLRLVRQMAKPLDKSEIAVEALFRHSERGTPLLAT